MEKWWKVTRWRPLFAAQQHKAVEFLMAWIEKGVELFLGVGVLFIAIRRGETL